MLSDNSGELSSNEISNIIGSDYFRDEIIRTYLKKELNDIDKREQPTLARIASHFGVGINGISSNTKRCDEKLLTNKAFRKQLQEIDGLLHENTKAKA